MNTEFNGVLHTDNNRESSETDIKGATSVFLSSMAAVLSVEFPIASAGIAIFGNIMTHLWPEDNEHKYWNAVSENVSDLINTSIDKASYNLAMSRLEGMQIHTKRFYEYLKLWLDDGSNLDNVKDHYRQLIGLFDENMPLFRVKGQELLLLSLYANAAYSNINVLRTGYQYIDSWGLDTRDFSEFSNSQSKICDEIKLKIQQYTNHVISTYREGLKKIQKSPSKNWIDYNNFKLIHTGSSLGWITLLPQYNPEIYANEVDYRPFNDMLKQLILPIFPKEGKMFDELNDIIGFEKKYCQPRCPTVFYNMSLKVANVLVEDYTGTWENRRDVMLSGFHAIKGNTISTDGFMSLQPYGSGHNIDYHYAVDIVMTGVQKPPFKVDGFFYDARSHLSDIIGISGAINEINFHSVHDKKNYKLYQIGFKGEVLTAFSTGEDLDNEDLNLKEFSYQLSSIDVLTVDRSWDCYYLFWWSSHSLMLDVLPFPSKNSAQNTPVQQYHAIRATTSIQKQNLKIIQNPGFTGGPLVCLAMGESLKFELIKESTTRWFSPGKYKVRIWFLRGSGEVKVSVNISTTILSEVSESIRLGDNNTNIEEINYDDLLFFNFKEEVLIPKNTSEITIDIRNDSLVGDIIIDRMELIYLQ